MAKRIVDDALTRFSSRVTDYVKYRPGYPREVVDYLYRAGALGPGGTIADVGSGTGISSRLFLEAGHPVYAVEPNDDMRGAAEQLLGGFPDFRSIAGTAEATGLPDQSIDLVVCAQAFHWFDFGAARREFARILRPRGQVLLMWNDRRRVASEFGREYDELLRTYGIDYEKVRHDRVPQQAVVEFFAPAEPTIVQFPNSQTFDFEGLKGRLRSSSYAPLPDHPNHAPMLDALRALYEQYADADGRATIEYDTRLFHGRLQ